MRKALNNLLYVPFKFEDAGTKVIHYSPENFEVMKDTYGT